MLSGNMYMTLHEYYPNLIPCAACCVGLGEPAIFGGRCCGPVDVVSEELAVSREHFLHC